MRSPMSARLMPHLHLSLQAGDDMILKRMKRRHCAPMPLRSAIRYAGYGLMLCSAPISSPASRPRPKRCSRARSIWSTNVDRRSFTSSRSRRVPARRPHACRSSTAPSSKSAHKRLRNKGEAALRRYLDHRSARSGSVLTERSGIGRTEQFTAVRLAPPIEPGPHYSILSLRGTTGGNLSLPNRSGC